MLEMHLCSLLSFAIKIINLHLDNVVLRSRFQVKQFFLLDATDYTRHLKMLKGMEEPTCEVLPTSTGSKERGGY